MAVGRGTWIGAGISIVIFAALAVTTRSSDPRVAAALIYEVEALGCALLAPWIAARAIEDEQAGSSAHATARVVKALAVFLGAAIVATFVSVARGEPGIASAIFAQAIVLLEGVLVAALTIAVGTKAGPTAGLAAGLGLAALQLGFPYVGGDLLAALPRDLEAVAVSWVVVLCPAIVLAGTGAGTEPFHTPVLYERFRPVGEGHVGFQHASAPRAIAVQATIAAIMAGIAYAVRRLPRRAAGVVVASVIALFVMAPSRAEAQNIFGSDTSSSGDGSFGAEVRLGYNYPFLEGNFKVAAFNHALASRFDLNKDLHVQSDYVLPTFELQVGVKGTARAWFDYYESYYAGYFFKANDVLRYRNIFIPPEEVGVVDYRFRTLGMHGAISIPILDFITLEIVATTRYVWFESRVRAPRVAFFVKDQGHLEALIPGLGPGFDFFILDKLYAYGDLAWIDFSVPKKNPLAHYREGHLGLRFEFFQTIKVGLEVLWLDIDLQNSRFNYVQRILGPRIWVGAAF